MNPQERLSRIDRIINAVAKRHGVSWAERYRMLARFIDQQEQRTLADLRL